MFNPPRKLLVGIDFSVASEIALGMALAIAGRSGGELHLAHALDERARRPTGFEPLDRILGFEPEARRRRSRATEALVQQALRHGIPTEHVHVLAGEPVGELVALRERLGSELLALGGAGLRGARQLLLGSQADRLLRRPGCPLLLVREAPRTGVLKRVGVALEDPDDPSLPWLEYAVGLTDLLVGELTVLHAASHAATPLAGDVAKRVAASIARIDPALEVETRVEVDEPAHFLPRACRAASLDLLVMGAERQSDGWPGRVTNHVARADVPALLVVWPPEECPAHGM